MHSMNVLINKLWQLEVSGISSPTETEKEKGDLDLNDFNDKTKIPPNGRYEVELPWKYDSKNLPSNKELVWKRHERMINRFGKGEFFSDYQKVFQNWEKFNAIERVPAFELNRELSRNYSYFYSEMVRSYSNQIEYQKDPTFSVDPGRPCDESAINFVNPLD
ncbi:hypothetical protein AVEN_27397-1 [Araneus ventricosus]|uniref:Uncharacterized protein n=1 Tax=Araneus ventricosus TaxID=182803 RepID=A0A4Y2NLW1_ARAVE|nr:hypothetical protein AVEN_27397-1 [Araneus ventricosus]